MIAIQPKSRQILGVNQQAYQALKAAMSLNLRRQLLVAVCDNVVLQNQLATQLENDLAEVNWLLPRERATASGGVGASVGLERLVFDPEEAHLPRQVAQWVRQTMLTEGSLPQVQMLGIEQMTRQPAMIQNHFLRSLEQVEALLPRLNTSLLVWVPWPWLRTIQSSSPTFWKWRNGVFEFVSDPTPALLGSDAPAGSQFSAPPPLPSRSLAQPSLGDDASGESGRHRDQLTEKISHVSTANRVSAPAASVADYPRVEIPQVVALYGETDDSEISDHGQPTLETIATWETVDVVATTVQTAPEPEENSVPNTSALDTSDLDTSALETTALDTSQQSHDDTLVRYNQADLSASEESILLAAATVSLSAPQSVVQEEEALKVTAISTGAVREAGQQTDASSSLGAQRQSVEHPAEQSHLLQKRSVQSESVQGPVQTSAPAQSQSAQRQPAQNPKAQSQSAQRQSAQSSKAQTQRQPAQQPNAQNPKANPQKRPVQQAIQSSKAAPQTKATFDVPTTFGQQTNRDSAERAAIAANQKAQRQQAADDYFEVGHSYRRRIEAGERGLELIEPAIAAYEGALRCLSGPHRDWGSGLNDLGTLYWLKAQQLDDQQQVIDCMSQSIQLYSQALTKIDLAQSTDIACQLYSNLGAVFSMLAIRKDPLANFRKSAEAYLKALPFCPISVDPQEFATLQNSLGSVYWKLSHYEQDKMQVSMSLQQAISAYEQAGLAYSPYERPLDYAAVQNNLGITYWSLAKHQDAVSALKKAISSYRDALNYRTPESDAAACAITYNNLALAYWDLSKDDNVSPEPKRRYQRHAITAFEAALQTANRVGTLSKEDSAAIHHCLGDVHAQMVEGAPSTAEKTDSLQASLLGYVRAIDAVSMESPIFQARLAAIVANLRSHRDQLGLASQQAAFNQVPAHLFSLVMQSL